MTLDEHDVLRALSDLQQARDPITDWAFAQSTLKKARKDALGSIGHTEESLKELEHDADTALGTADEISTEFGIVQRIPDKPTQYRTRRSNRDTEPTMWKHRLKHTTKEK